MSSYSRREFLRTSSGLAGSVILGNFFSGRKFGTRSFSEDVPLSGHLWVYASKFPPDWDCTPILDEVFSDFQYAGLEGVEVMESILRHDDVVPRVSDLIRKYDIPVTGSSYYADMWDRSQHQKIIEDVELVVGRLQKLGGSTFGITVGDAGRKKTESELDDQADLLKMVMEVCSQNNIQPNLHNHTFEIEHDMHDLKGTMKRVPELPLGPDLNWLVRGGIDPVWFIRTYGNRMQYMHLRDQDAEGRWTKAVGEGVTDFSSIAEALREVNFKGRAAIELAYESPPEKPVRDEWKNSREYVKNVFGW